MAYRDVNDQDRITQQALGDEFMVTQGAIWRIVHGVMRPEATA